MKKIIIFLLLMFVTQVYSAVAKCEDTKLIEVKLSYKKGIEGMQEMAAKDAKVFLVCADSVAREFALASLNQWNYWNIEVEKANANFILEISSNKSSLFKWEIYARFFDMDGEEIYKTQPSAKFGIGKLKARQASTNYLINNIIRPIFELD